MFVKYYAKNKREIFPWVKDWTSPQNQLRYSNNIKDMPFNTWFFFHPSAYKIIFYGFNGVAMAIFSLSGLFLYLKGVFIGLALCVALAGYFGYNLHQKLKEREAIRDFTFYDLYMREFSE